MKSFKFVCLALQLSIFAMMEAITNNPSSTAQKGAEERTYYEDHDQY